MKNLLPAFASAEVIECHVFHAVCLYRTESLYTPQRLSTLNLSAWPQEPVNDAPCYYIAYNTACAYSRIGKGKESLGWLEVAFAMNKEVKGLAVGDKDLSYVRENFRKDFDHILLK
jgi:hypothetical protein